MTHDTLKANDAKSGKTPIYIDGTKYHPEGDSITGAQLRQIPSPPVSPDRDLWLETRDGLDQLIEDGQVVKLENNLRFFSVPRVINPGQGPAKTGA